MKSKAWPIPDNAIPPKLPGTRKWWVLRLAMGITRDRCEKGVPKKFLRILIPPFVMVATDREAAKKDIAAKIDELFDAMEENEVLKEAEGRTK